MRCKIILTILFDNRVKCSDCQQGGVGGWGGDGGLPGGRARLFQNAMFMHEEIKQIKIGDFLLEFGSKSF